MNDDDLDALFKALLSRKQDDVEKLQLYKRRDALPPSMRNSPAVYAELILQFDHEQRMHRIAMKMSDYASKAAKRTTEETVQRCLQEVSVTFTTMASVSITKLVQKVEHETAKRFQSEGGGDIFAYMGIFVGGMLFSFFIIYAMNRLGLR